MKVSSTLLLLAATAAAAAAVASPLTILNPNTGRVEMRTEPELEMPLVDRAAAVRTREEQEEEDRFLPSFPRMRFHTLSDGRRRAVVAHPEYYGPGGEPVYRYHKRYPYAHG